MNYCVHEKVRRIHISDRATIFYNEKETALNAELSRQSFLSQAVVALFGSTALIGGQESAIAATYGSFGASSPAVIDPKDAEIDTEIMSTKVVQNAIDKIKGYKSVVAKMEASLESDSQVNLNSVILKELDFANLRESFNIYNSAFEEDTQRGTDRLIRVIMQDITELEIANKQKDDIARSPRRVETMKGKLAKLDQAFSDILAYSK